MIRTLLVALILGATSPGHIASAIVPDRLDPIVSAPLVINASSAIPEVSPGTLAAKLAMEQVGKRYSWGANGPDTFDCSGLAQFAWAAQGVEIPHYTGNQWHELRHFPLSEIQPGDLIYTRNLGHVYVYVGDGQVVHAPGTGKRISVVPMPDHGIQQEVARPG